MLRTSIGCSGASSYRFSNIFFFFQAEDGIRDYKVTGVQTCALPIYADAGTEVVAGRSSGGDVLGAGLLIDVIVRSGDQNVGIVRVHRDDGLVLMRSEERRVGKECRSRWSPYH